MTSWVHAAELYEHVHLMMEWRRGEPMPDPADCAEAIQAVSLEVYKLADLTKSNPISGVQHLLDRWFMDSLTGRRYGLYVSWSYDPPPTRYDA